MPIASNVSVVDGITNTKLGDIPVGIGPLPSIAIDSYMQKVYVANPFGGGVSVIKTCLYCARSTLSQTKQEVIPIRGEDTSIAVDTELPSPKVYVTNPLAGNVSVIEGDTNTMLRDIHVGGRPISIAVNENTHTVYAENPSTGNVSVISVSVNTYRNGVYVYAPKLAKDIPVGSH
jgi:YVTN family beta-propeller protein